MITAFYGLEGHIEIFFVSQHGSMVAFGSVGCSGFSLTAFNLVYLPHWLFLLLLGLPALKLLHFPKVLSSLGNYGV
jgi:hypothetical protein